MSTNWFDFADTSAIPEGSRKILSINGIAIAVFNIDNHYYAIKDECPHANRPFAETGPLEGHRLTCPHHGAEFCLRSGAVKSPPAFEDLTCYSTRIQDNKIQIHLDL